eukprot:jgi/Mesen1/2616/ME000166S01740
MAVGLLQRPSTVYRTASPKSASEAYIPSSPFIIKTDPPPDLNKNTSWFLYPGAWSMYFFIVMFSWLLILSVLNCSVGTAWTLVNIIHFAVTFYLFHWKKGSPFCEDQGMYDKLTWWEQLDDGRQFSNNRKFLTVVPVIMYLVASYTMRDHTYYSSALLLNTVIVFTLIIAKAPFLHKVRIFGINSDYPT